jgi:preprotein translocase subunit SecF
MKQIDFVKNRKIFIGISVVILLVFLVLYIINGVVLDITFRGGTRMSIECSQGIDSNQAAVLLEGALGKKVNTSIMETVGGGTAGTKKTVMLRIDVASTQPLTSEEEDVVRDTLVNAGFPVILDSPSNEVLSIEPSIGAETLNRGLLAVGISSVLILFYVAWRFSVMSGFAAAVCAIIALLHDVGMMLGVYVAFRMPFNDVFIAAILTIIGYSINDTIIIYDRIRENANTLKKSDMGTIVNVSIWQSLPRSINTMLTTLISVAVLFIFAAVNSIGSLKDFSLSLIIGVISGCYSSIFIASPIWLMWRERRMKAKLAQ